MSEPNLYLMQERAMHIAKLYTGLNEAEGHEPWTPTDYMSGLVGDVGDLSKLVMAREGKRTITDVDKKIEHEFGDCLWSLLVLAKKLGIDPAHAFDRTMAELEARFDGGQA
jgi:NTP pyrophosphatase (non-canonical NTP hydrolase)